MMGGRINRLTDAVCGSRCIRSDTVLLDQFTTCDKSPETLLMGECISRSDRSPAPPDTTSPSHLRFCGSGLESRESLFQSAPVTERWIHVYIIKSDCDDWNQQNGQSQKEGEPEVTRTEGHPQTSQILISNKITVNEESHGEIESN